MTASAPRYTLLYDGNCRICTGQARTVAAYDDDGRIELLDLNDPIARARFPQVALADARRELHLVSPDGALHRGVAAVRETLLRLPSLRGLGELLRLPGATALAGPVYAFIARNRYLLGGQAASCDDGACDPAARPARPEERP